MAIKELELTKQPKLRVVKNDEAEVVVADGVAIITDAVAKDVSFPNLPTAIQRLVTLLADAEDKKLAAARVVQAIDRQQLYREAGCETMSEFYPLLLQQTAAVGWQAERTVKLWLAFANLYLDQMELPEGKAMKANSHLHALYVLGDVDRKTGELKDDVKEGKLPSGDFEAVVQVVTGLVTAPAVEQKVSGLDDAATRAMLTGAGVREKDIDTLKARANLTALALPMNGWTVADTKALIEAIKGEKPSIKAVQVWYLTFQDEERVEIDRIAWEIEGEEKRSLPWAGEKVVGKAEFEAMSKGDKVVDASEGEPDGEDDGFTSDADDE